MLLYTEKIEDFEVFPWEGLHLSFDFIQYSQACLTIWKTLSNNIMCLLCMVVPKGHSLFSFQKTYSMGTI